MFRFANPIARSVVGRLPVQALRPPSMLSSVKSLSTAKLYYTPTSCGAASFISAFTAGVKLDSEVVDLRSHKTASGIDFYSINPKGNVPTIITETGTLLNENIATLLYIADQNPGSIAPKVDSPQRLVLVSALSYIATEIHPSVGSFFLKPKSPDVRALFQERLDKKLTYLENTFIGKKQFLVGETFSIADAYLYICLTWTQYVGIDLTKYPSVQNYLKRIGSLENVQKAHARMKTAPATTV